MSLQKCFSEEAEIVSTHPAEPRHHQHQLTSAVILIGCMTLVMTGHDRERKYTTDWCINSGRKQQAEQKMEKWDHQIFLGREWQ